MKQAYLMISLLSSAALVSGCIPLVLYGPQTYYVAETSVVSAPFEDVYSEYDVHAPDSPLSVTFGDKDPSRLKHLSFASATMTNEDGVVTQLRLRWGTLENPNSFRMTFYKADFLGHDLRFRLTVLSNGQPMRITFQTRFKSKVVWPKDSDYSG